MSTFQIETKFQHEAAAFEQTLRTHGWVERPGATSSSLLPSEYTKRYGSSDPNSFSGTPTVTFEIRKS